MPCLRAAQQRLDMRRFYEERSLAVLLGFRVCVQLQQRKRAIRVQHRRARGVAKSVRIHAHCLFVACGPKGFVALQTKRLGGGCRRSRLLARLRLRSPILESDNLLAQPFLIRLFSFHALYDAIGIVLVPLPILLRVRQRTFALLGRGGIGSGRREARWYLSGGLLNHRSHRRAAVVRLCCASSLSLLRSRELSELFFSFLNLACLILVVSAVISSATRPTASGRSHAAELCVTLPNVTKPAVQILNGSVHLLDVSTKLKLEVNRHGASKRRVRRL
mmetsp:Transcript_31351/g.81911  ORF Transcript_31351/g.81911 Transcript_31351/m.81911 type:complete len:276 (+) Transcript_31351:300-1127(+)